MNHLHNAIKKCRHEAGREWGGYLIPKEILALADLGVECRKDDVKQAVYRKQNGLNHGRWFYFIANKKFEILKSKIKIH